MKTLKYALPICAVLLTGTLLFAVTTTRYLHVRVNNAVTHEVVRVNVPLSLAEKIIPAINKGKLHDGKVHIGKFKTDDVNLPQILDALKTAPEGEFVTVQQNDNDVRVAKEHGMLVVHVVDQHSKENVDVTVPWEVAQALSSDVDENQLNIEAGIKALEKAGDVTLVSVVGKNENVRIWVDSSSSAE